jgi:hypothetical protein
VVVRDVRERRAGDVGENAAVEKAAHAGVAEQASLAQQPTVGRKRARQRFAQAPLDRQGLRQRVQRRQREKADDSQHPEDRTPLHHRDDQAANAGSQHRGERGDDHQRGHHLCRPMADVQVPHDRACQRDAGAGADRLQRAPDNHLFDALRDRATDGADDVQDHPDRDRPAAPDAIAERPPEELPEAEPDQVPGEREFHRSVPCVERTRHRGQGRQVDVRREGGERHEDAQDQQRLQVVRRGKPLQPEA